MADDALNISLREAHHRHVLLKVIDIKLHFIEEESILVWVINAGYKSKVKHASVTDFFGIERCYHFDEILQ